MKRNIWVVIFFVNLIGGIFAVSYGTKGFTAQSLNDSLIRVNDSLNHNNDALNYYLNQCIECCNDLNKSTAYWQARRDSIVANVYERMYEDLKKD